MGLLRVIFLKSAIFHPAGTARKGLEKPERRIAAAVAIS